MASIGDSIYALLRRLFPINRSITGDGVRETLCIIAEELPALTIHEVPSGTQVFDWVVPREWNVRDAYVLDPDGNKIIDFAKSNLHLVGYSIPVIRKVSLSELEEHLYSLPDQPAVIPYIISYYEERWGFCITHRRRQMITKEGEYTVVIDSELKDGYLTYGELRIPGERQEEVFFSTYICHPSMANNELSGPTVTTFLAKWLLSQKRKYSYRIVFIPETIGSITYLSRNLDEMKRRIIAGYNVTCVGDDSCYSFLPSRQEDSLADRAALHVLKHLHPNFIFIPRRLCHRRKGPTVPHHQPRRYPAHGRHHPRLQSRSHGRGVCQPDALQGAHCPRRVQRRIDLRSACHKTSRSRGSISQADAGLPLPRPSWGDADRRS